MSLSQCLTSLRAPIGELAIKAAEAGWGLRRGSNRAKRLFDAGFAALGLCCLSPLFLLIGIAIKLSDGGPVFYRQQRIGQFGKPFLIWKFRTMMPGSDRRGPSITSQGDDRVTRIGGWLRRAKLDELPQLINVLAGEMSLVGPRPEVPRYVAAYTANQRRILRHQPGITDLASLCFRHEEALLQTNGNTEEFYLSYCVPRKLQLNQEYARKANLWTDAWIILRTVCPYWLGVSGLYAAVLALALWLSEALAGSGAGVRFFGEWPMVVSAQLLFLLGGRQRTGLLCYFGPPELRQAARGLLLASLTLLGASWLVASALPARNVLIVNLFIASFLLIGMRLALRSWRERAEGADTAPEAEVLRVGIIGAGGLGAQLALCLNSQRRLGRSVVVFFDDDFGKWQRRIHGVPVAGMPECLLQGWTEKLDEVAIAMPHASPRRLREIRRLCRDARLRVRVVDWPAPANSHPGIQAFA